LWLSSPKSSSPGCVLSSRSEVLSAVPNLTMFQISMTNKFFSFSETSFSICFSNP
jgi:hypothetical protein